MANKSKKDLPKSLAPAIAPEQVETVAALEGVTPAGIRLLHTYEDPLNRDLTPKQRQEMAEITRDTWCRLVYHDDRFIQAYNKLFFATAMAAAVPILQGMIEKGLKGDTDAGKAVLNYAGYGQTVARVDHTHKIEPGNALLKLFRQQGKPQYDDRGQVIDV